MSSIRPSIMLRPKKQYNDEHTNLFNKQNCDEEWNKQQQRLEAKRHIREQLAQHRGQVLFGSHEDKMELQYVCTLFHALVYE